MESHKTKMSNALAVHVLLLIKNNHSHSEKVSAMTLASRNLYEDGFLVVWEKLVDLIMCIGLYLRQSILFFLRFAFGFLLNKIHLSLQLKTVDRIRKTE